MNRIPPAAVRLALACLAAGLPAATFGQQEEPPDPARWEEKIRAFEALDREVPPAPGGILFLGSSSIRMWDLDDSFPGLRTINRGFGGSWIRDSTHFATRIVLPYAPRAIVFYAGDNDIAGGLNAAQALEDFVRFAEWLGGALPETTLVFLSIKPSPARWELWPEMKKANEAIAGWCRDHPRRRFADIAPVTLAEGGEPDPALFAEDGLHLNAEGYARWTGVVKEALPLMTNGQEDERPAPPGERPRAREAGLVVGVLPTGAHNTITDVAGVAVGHSTVIEGDDIRTGVTAILPHGGNLFREKVPAAIVVANGFGKLIGATQVRELGEIETPILLTSTLCVWRAADALVATLLERDDMAGVRSINPVVGETNDGYLNDIRSRPVRAEHVREALASAVGGPVEEGSVGAGTGTVAFGWKGGIGTSSRMVRESAGGWTVGVLVQSNFGGDLTINGAPVGSALKSSSSAGPPPNPDGSIMIVVATDAPLSPGSLRRLGNRALVGLARTGSVMSNGSGDYVIAFSTAESVRRREGSDPRDVRDLPNEAMTPLFQAVAEATEESIYNSLFRATTGKGHRGTVEALPLRETRQVLERHRVVEGPR